MPSSFQDAASQNQDFVMIAAARQPVSVARNKTAGLGVIMQQAIKKIRVPFFIFLAAVLFALAGSPDARSQTTPSAAKSQVDQQAVAAANLAAASTTPAPDTVAPRQANPNALLIGNGDLLKVAVLGAPESDQEVRVGADGNIFLNFVGAVHVSGLNIEQAQSTIAKKLIGGGFFRDPQVSVFAKEYATQGVSVLGEVLKPGVYPLLGSRSLFDVLSLAGGTTPKAGRLVSIAHRDTPQKPTTVAMSNDAAESAKSNIEIFPGDTVVVSKAGVVYVVGDVKKPSGVPMENGSMTVLQAVAMAEGPNPTAAMNRAKVIRKMPGGVPQETPLDLKKMLSSKIPDVNLQAEDILFIPSSAAKNASRRTMETIINTATGMLVYGARF
jgi:polysaccharide export outer membrane protein